MKTKLIALLIALSASLSFGHGGVEIGPNGGRLVELSKDESLHGEVTVKEGKFHIALFDKDLKPVKVADQVLTATGGTREKPAKLETTKTDDAFSVPVVKEGQWLILQFKDKADAKPVTARFKYDTDNCDACDSPEWICKCEAEKEKGKGKEAEGKKK